LLQPAVTLVEQGLGGAEHTPAAGFRHAESPENAPAEYLRSRDQDDLYAQERLLLEVTGRTRLDRGFVASDVMGQIDLDVHNPGPELDPHG